jgi:hypothetical protein
MVTEAKPNQREVGLRILARMIVRDYLGEIDRGEAGPAAFKEDEKEVNHANKRSNRGCKASPPGKDKAGDKTGES